MINPYTHDQQKRATWWLLLVLGLFLAYALRDYFTAFFGSLIFYTLFRPWYIVLVEKKKWKRSWSATLVLLVSFLIIILPAGLMVLQVAEKIVDLTKDPAFFNEMLDKVQHHPLYQKYVNPTMIKEQLNQAGQWGLSLFSSTLNSVLNAIALLAVMYLVLYFMFVNYREMEQWLIKYAPFSEDNVLDFGEEIKNATRSNVIGQGFVSCVQGSLVGLSFWLFGIPEPLFYGLVAIFASFLPIVGSAIIFVPGAIYAFITGNTAGGTGMLLVGYIVIINIDNVLRLVISKKLGDAHPLITLLGIIVGLPFFGLVGLVIGPLLISFFVLMLKIYLSTFLKYNKKSESGIDAVEEAPAKAEAEKNEKEHKQSAKKQEKEPVSTE
jgi:predicted PurR-regulated permease PerM